MKSIVRSRRIALGALALVAAFLACPAFGQKPASESTLKRVLVLGTGGTISGQASVRASGAYDSGKVSAAELVAAVPGVDKLARVSAEQISAIGSQDMNDGVWFDLVKRVKTAVDRKEADGIVITHGTDTMEETAFFLDMVLDTQIPVVLVGAMRPSNAVGADGPVNIYEAVKVAAAPETRGRGVLVVLSDTIHGARWVQKTNTSSLDSIRSPNAGPVGYVDAISTRYVQTASRSGRTRLQLPDAPPLPRVDIIYSHANMDALPIEDALKRGARGIVLAGDGDGNTSKAAIEALAAAVRQGVTVIRSTRVCSGFVSRNVEVDDDGLGFVVSQDLNPQKARILLQLLIANGIRGTHDIQRAFLATW
jgi:L-asparaginase